VVRVLSDFLIAIAVSFITIFTTELGDKTQIFAFLMATYFNEKKWLVLLSVFTGMSLVTGLGLVLSLIFKQFIEVSILQIIGGSVFILLGLISLAKIFYDLVRRKNSCEIGDEEQKAEKYINKLKDVKNMLLFVLVLSFLFVIMELGDKSQIMVLCLFLIHTWYGVFIGAMAAFVILNGIGIFVASLVRKWCKNNPTSITIISSLISIVLGIWILLG